MICLVKKTCFRETYFTLKEQQNKLSWIYLGSSCFAIFQQFINDIFTLIENLMKYVLFMVCVYYVLMSYNFFTC